MKRLSILLAILMSILVIGCAQAQKWRCYIGDDIKTAKQVDCDSLEYVKGSHEVLKIYPTRQVYIMPCKMKEKSNVTP